jgi:hypothetical protein
VLGFDRLPFHDTQEPLDLGESTLKVTTGPRHVLDVIEWRWRNAQAVTECAGKEALSGPREAFTRHSGVNPSPGSPPGLC